jgi:sec-independent protein translocase protein TatB
MNSFFGLGPMELALIIFIALIVLGPERLPGTIREVMKYWKYFRNLSSELTSQFSEELKGLEDLDPKRILNDLANELDEEMEQTKEAAGVKKPVAKKPAAKKATGTKKTDTKKTTTPKKSDVSDSAAVKAGDAKPAVQDQESKQEETDTGRDGQTPAQKDDEPAVEDAEQLPVGQTADSENTILPPENADESELLEQAASEQPSDEETQTDTVAAERKDESDVLGSREDGDAAERAESGSTPAAKGAFGSAKPTPVSVNGKGARPEDE